ncbi:interferon-induced 44-like protein [Labeo rohita]|uniref:Interferon-induced 44-like protein n=1 Tax=Labeo rohita TaxID=84645 RepID=A0A498LTK7_LABRO|nr:interferon-induced 44-like protein [Labeo rohita]
MGGEESKLESAASKLQSTASQPDLPPSQGIPQVIIMTKVDEACPLVKNDLKKVYTSKKIKEKMHFCSEMIGVPMNCIFPVKNYHDEIDTDDDVDVLVLKAFDQIVNFAHERLMEAASN